MKERTRREEEKGERWRRWWWGAHEEGKSVNTKSCMEKLGLQRKGRKCYEFLKGWVELGYEASVKISLC